jgi:NitT/TauT family transport system permease protein
MQTWVGEAAPPADRSRRAAVWGDALALLVLAGLLFWLIVLARGRAGAAPAGTAIDLSPWALPDYALRSLARVLAASAISLAFALLFGYWTAKDAVAGRVLVPLLDFCRRGVPVLGLMPVLVLALWSAFPAGDLGLELAAVLVIVLAQFWPMTSSFRHALRAVPREQQEMAAVFQLSAWQRFKWVELPGAAMGLIWNSMMGMARGWFVLMVSETFVLGDRDFRLPGVGSYLRSAVEQDRPGAVLAALGAMAGMIVLSDQVLWRPLVVWAQKFRPDEAGAAEATSSWFLTWLRYSRLVRLAGGLWPRLRRRRATPPDGEAPPRPNGLPVWVVWPARLGVLALFLPAGYGAWRLAGVLRAVPAEDWAPLAWAALATLGRVLAAVALGTLWALPVGLAIGLSPRRARLLQSPVQLLASFPASLVFPLLMAGLEGARISLGWGSVVLMFLPAQSYILFNVIAGAMTIPADLQEAVRSYDFSAWHRFRALYLPAVFPFLVRGWDAAASVAWGTSVVAEYVTLGGEVHRTWGVGAWISAATQAGDFPALAAGVLVMLVARESFNRLVWEPCYQLARHRYTLER